jgi:hypothetical protein
MSSPTRVGTPPRLNRDLSGSFGSRKYAYEEIAEITSAFMCASLGIVPTVRHADFARNGSRSCGLIPDRYHWSIRVAKVVHTRTCPP